jgi:glycosyltransferase involved in cell wall biosynthesis
MYEKFGISISGMEGLEVHIAGFKPAEERDRREEKQGKLIFHPIFNFKRLSLSRLFAPWKLFKILLKVKPHIIIATTFEILIVTILYKILFGAVMLYDVQENYYRNILYNKTYPPLIRNILAIYTRLIEYISRPFISQYILAERNYEKEFSFSKGKSIVIENKYKNLPGEQPVLSRIRPRSRTPIRLLYSGTISEEYGIFEAVNLAEKLHETDYHISLEIIGYCSKIQTLTELKRRIDGKNFISLTGGSSIVNHQIIIKAINKADFGLLSYQPNKSTENCIPTRLFEYQAHLLPMIIQENKLWEEICKPYQSALFINYRNFDHHSLLRQMTHTVFYPKGPVQDIFWKSEEPKLQNLIAKYLN